VHLSIKVARELDSTNLTGQFRMYKEIRLDGKYTEVCFYYITNLGHSYIGEVPGSNDPAAWKEFYERAEAAGEERLTRSAKKPRHWDDIDTALLDFNSKTKDLQVRLKEVVPVYEYPPYWESTEAKNILCPKPDETVEDALARRCKALDGVINEPDGYKLILPGDGDPYDLYSAEERMTLQLKAMHMRLAYKLALDKMGSGLSWGECCKEAADSLAKAGIRIGSSNQLRSGMGSIGWRTRSIARCHRQYRVEDTLPHSNPFYTTGLDRNQNEIPVSHGIRQQV
jgi:hypothetical protein